MKSNTAKGYLCVIAAALMWASCGTVGKALFNAGMSPFILVQTRVTLASLIMIITLLVFRPGLLKITLRDFCFFLLFGGVFMALMQLSYFMAISKIQVATAILVQYMAPVLVACFSMLFWHERVSGLKILALLLSHCRVLSRCGGVQPVTAQHEPRGHHVGAAVRFCLCIDYPAW